MEYKIRRIVSRDDTLFSISLFNLDLMDVVICSPPRLAICNSLSIRSFSSIKKKTLELVALAYALVALDNANRCLRMLDMITHSSNCIGDAWTSGVVTLRDYTTLFCDSLNEILCISTSGLSSRISISPLSFKTCSTFRSSEVDGLTSCL